MNRQPYLHFYIGHSARDLRRLRGSRLGSSMLQTLPRRVGVLDLRVHRTVDCTVTHRAGGCMGGCVELTPSPPPSRALLVPKSRVWGVCSEFTQRCEQAGPCGRGSRRVACGCCSSPVTLTSSLTALRPLYRRVRRSAVRAGACLTACVPSWPQCPLCALARNPMHLNKRQ